MKLFFITKAISVLSDCDAKILYAVKSILLSFAEVEETSDPEDADAIIIQEENSFKNFRYIKNLKSDHIVSRYAEKIFTINTDDCATGLLRGLYTSLPKYRYNPAIYRVVPYMYFPNYLAFKTNSDQIKPTYLAGWRGNTKSNRLRPKMVRLLQLKKEFCIEETRSWLNHHPQEQNDYVNLIRSAKFSLCPAGWAPVSFRIYESMALGRCPVIIADDFVPPDGPAWNNFALFYPEKELKDLPSFLLDKSHLADKLGKAAFDAWQQYFNASVIAKYYARNLLSLIKLTPKTSKKAELRRYSSLHLTWNNKWTVTQRLINKVVRAIHRQHFLE